MSNMSYCRFENTAGDLLDCQEHILEALGNDYEKFGRISLVKSCIGILEDLGCSVQNSDYEEIVVEDAEAILEKAGVNRPDPDDEEEEHEGPKTAEEVDNSLDGRGPGEPKPELEIIGHDGNAFGILGKALKAARRAKWTQEKTDKMMEEAKSGDYDNLLRVMTDYFDVI